MTAEIERIGRFHWPVGGPVWDCGSGIEGDPNDRALPGVDYEQADWDKWVGPQIWQIHAHYIDERLRRRGSDIPRARSTFRNLCLYFGPDADPTKLKIADFIRYEEHRYSQGVHAPTVHRELVFHKAAMNHARKRERITLVPYMELPSGAVIHERPAATEGQVKRLWATPMPWRIRMFFLLAYWTGHRAQAIEQLTWDRVDFQRRMIDFNVPGRIVNNKRRNPAFPIPDALLPRLIAAYERHKVKCPDDPFVIGKGCTTYQGCKDAWKRAGVDIEGFCRHAFRKTFVTELVKAGEKLETAATLIADNPGTAGRHYFKLDQDYLRGAVNRREAA